MKRLIALVVFSFCANTLAQTGSSSAGDHAHPCNFHQTNVISWGGVLTFQYEWDSTSGVLADLSQVQVGEYVTYSDGGVHVGPGRPWTGNDPNPTQAGLWRPGTDGGLVDTHSDNGPQAGPADSYTATQYYGFYCQKCGTSVNLHGFHGDLLGPIPIVRCVELVNGSWQYRINKNGAQGVKPLP